MAVTYRGNQPAVRENATARTIKEMQPTGGYNALRVRLFQFSPSLKGEQ
jgi:hypothetical protein